MQELAISAMQIQIFPFSHCRSICRISKNIISISFRTFHFLRRPRKAVPRFMNRMDVLKKETVPMKDCDVLENKYSQLTKGGSSKLQMEVLKKKTVHMKDRGVVENKLSQLIKGGPSKLQVISDFDQTLTRVHKDGIRCATTYGILEDGPFITEDYRHQANCLFEYYHPIESDPHLTKAEKLPHMIEWYTKSLNLMTLSGVYRDKIPAMVEASNVCLREGCDRVFESLNEHDVPLLIFSAGIGDILKEVLRQRNLLLPNMKIIANYMKFDEKNKIAGFEGSLIHTFNKNQSSIANSDYFHTLKSRNNIILLGDSLGDLDMSEGAQDVDVILRIGFLNHRVEESLTDYMDAFDIVLTDDQTMDVVNGLLHNILG